MTFWRHWFDRGDSKIDALIAANRAVERYRTVDWTLVNRAGSKRWHEVAKAQGKRSASVLRVVRQEREG